MLLIVFALVLFASFVVKRDVKGYSHQVILGGESIGLELSTSVYVTGKYDVASENKPISPWKDSNIENGDIIVAIDNKSVNSISDIQKIINKLNVDIVNISLSRNNQLIETKINIVKGDNGQKSLGLYVKDSLLGVGTLTYIDKQTLNYGALGHAITNNRHLLNAGILSTSTVSGLRKSIPGVAGEKKAIINGIPIGTININSDYGIFGKFSSDKVVDEVLIDVASSDTVCLGEASLVTVIAGNKKEYFDIEIVEAKNQLSKDVKGIKFKVTDERLLSKTGGIIQGMSGSPIVQNGKLIGAVSHVVVDNPIFGYGIYIDWMIATEKSLNQQNSTKRIL